MNHLKLIREYLEEKRHPDDIPTSGNAFITISRQAGAGGHLLSYVLTSEMLKFQDEEMFRGWHVFDKQLCEVVAEDPKLQDSLQTLVREKYRPEFRDFVESLFTGQSNQYVLYKRTLQVVRMLAALGKVVLVGRASACITRDLPNGLHIRLVAPEAQRIIWMMNRFKLTKDEARKSMLEQDASRANLVRQFCNRDIGDPMLYDVVFNTGTVDMHDISHCVIETLRRRMARAHKAAE